MQQIYASYFSIIVIDVNNARDYSSSNQEILHHFQEFLQFHLVQVVQGVLVCPTNITQYSFGNF